MLNCLVMINVSMDVSEMCRMKKGWNFTAVVHVTYVLNGSMNEICSVFREQHYDQQLHAFHCSQSNFSTKCK
jgi:hypothetical protein